MLTADDRVPPGAQDTLRTPRLAPRSVGGYPAVMNGRAGRGRWERVLAARRQAREAQGRDPNIDHPFASPPKTRAAPRQQPPPAPIARHPSERTEYVLTLGEAAARLGVSRSQLEALIDTGKVEALPTGFTRTIPTREIDRLARAWNTT